MTLDNGMTRTGWIFDKSWCNQHDCSKRNKCTEYLTDEKIIKYVDEFGHINAQVIYQNLECDNYVMQEV